MAAAHALRQRGIDAVVFERAPQFLDLGVVHVWVNGVEQLRRLGLADAIAERATPNEEQEFRSERGGTLIHLPLREMTARAGVSPPLSVRRYHLLDALAGSLDEGVVRFGTACVGFDQDGDGVTLRLEGGREERGTLLVCADGLDSQMRRIFMPEVQPRYAGYQYTRVVTPIERRLLPIGKLSITIGRGGLFGAIQLSEHELYWWTVTVASEGTTQTDLARKDVVLGRYQDYPPPAREAIEATPDGGLFRKEIWYLEPLPHWSVGRVTLLGDAAHGTVPSLGRGAGEAIEDASALAAAVASRRSVADALLAYESVRRAPMTEVHKAALRAGKASTLTNPVLAALRDIGMRLVVGRMMLREMSADFERWGREATEPVAPPAAAAEKA